MNWAERHLKWALIIGVIGGPILGFWVCYGLLYIINLFAPTVAKLMIPATPLVCIVIVIIVVRWYKEKRKHIHNEKP